MNKNRGRIALVSSSFVLFATALLFTSTKLEPLPFPLLIQSSVDQFGSGADFSELIDLILAETDYSDTKEEFSIAAAVSSEQEISEADKAEILNLIIADVLQSSSFQHSRDFYGMPGKQSAVVVLDDELKLPRDFQAKVPGWKIEQRNPTTDDKDVDSDSPRLLAIYLNKFAPHKPARNSFDGHVTIVITNGGGNPDGVIHIGGCFASYQVQRSQGKWTVGCLMQNDP